MIAEFVLATYVQRPIVVVSCTYQGLEQLEAVLATCISASMVTLGNQGNRVGST